MEKMIEEKKRSQIQQKVETPNNNPKIHLDSRKTAPPTSFEAKNLEVGLKTNLAICIMSKNLILPLTICW